MELIEFTRKLYRLTGRLNLYLYFCYKKDKPDIIRLKKEINSIKQLISDIETQMNYL